jgi:large subunit ribosomal protein L6
MKKDLERTITLPEGFTAEAKENELTIKGNSTELTREFDLGRAKMKVNGTDIVLSAKGATRRESTMIGTTWAHVNNMIKGLSTDFEYILEVCNVHFPMNVKAEGDHITIKSFLGEKVDRVAKIVPGSTVEIKGTQITVTSNEIEKAGQTAANLEKATRLKGRDRRIFQDGIFITTKNGIAI